MKQEGTTHSGPHLSARTRIPITPYDSQSSEGSARVFRGWAGWRRLYLATPSRLGPRLAVMLGVRCPLANGAAIPFVFCRSGGHCVSEKTTRSPITASPRNRYSDLTGGGGDSSARCSTPRTRSGSSLAEKLRDYKARKNGEQVPGA